MTLIWLLLELSRHNKRQTYLVISIRIKYHPLPLNNKIRKSDPLHNLSKVTRCPFSSTAILNVNTGGFSFVDLIHTLDHNVCYDGYLRTIYSYYLILIPNYSTYALNIWPKAWAAQMLANMLPGEIIFFILKHTGIKSIEKSSTEYPMVLI